MAINGVPSPYIAKTKDVLGTVRPMRYKRKKGDSPYQGFQVNGVNWKPEYTKVLLATQRGITVEQISREVGISPRTINLVRSSTFFVQKLAGLNTKVIEKTVEKRSTMLATDKAREVLTKAALGAARRMIQLSKMGENVDKVKLLACQDIMDRAGLKPIEIIESRERVYSPEEVQSARAILQETEAIVMRLSNQTSPFVLETAFKKTPVAGDEKLVSSTTDESSDVPTDKEAAEDPSV